MHHKDTLGAVQHLDHKSVSWGSLDFQSHETANSEFIGSWFNSLSWATNYFSIWLHTSIIYVAAISLHHSYINKSHKSRLIIPVRVCIFFLNYWSGWIKRRNYNKIQNVELFYFIHINIRIRMERVTHLNWGEVEKASWVETHVYAQRALQMAGLWGRIVIFRVHSKQNEHKKPK